MIISLEFVGMIYWLRKYCQLTAPKGVPIGMYSYFFLSCTGKTFHYIYFSKQAFFTEVCQKTIKLATPLT